MTIEILVNTIIVPCVIPLTGILKKVLPKKVIPVVPIALALLANLIMAIIQGGSIEDVFLYGISSGSIGSSIYDAFKAGLSK